MNGHDTSPFHKYGGCFCYFLAVKEAFLFGGLWKREGRANRGGDGEKNVPVRGGFDKIRAKKIFFPRYKSAPAVID